MSSERPAVPTPVTEEVIREEARVEQAPVPPSPPSKEGDPFSSRQGSPRRVTTQFNTAATQSASPLSPHIHAPRSFDEKYGDADSDNSAQNLNRNNFNQGVGGGLPLPPLGTRPSDTTPGVRRTRTMDTRNSYNNQRRSAIDWIVPAVEAKVSLCYMLFINIAFDHL